MTAPKWTRQLKWSGPKLTLGDLRQFIKESAHLPDTQPVPVTAHNDQRDGSEVTLRVDSMVPPNPTTLSDVILVPSDAVYAQQYFDVRTGSYGYRFFNSNREPIDPDAPSELII